MSAPVVTEHAGLDWPIRNRKKFIVGSQKGATSFVDQNITAAVSQSPRVPQRAKKDTTATGGRGRALVGGDGADGIFRTRHWRRRVRVPLMSTCSTDWEDIACAAI